MIQLTNTTIDVMLNSFFCSCLPFPLTELMDHIKQWLTNHDLLNNLCECIQLNKTSITNYISPGLGGENMLKYTCKTIFKLSWNSVYHIRSGSKFFVKATKMQYYGGQEPTWMLPIPELSRSIILFITNVSISPQ